MVLVVWDLMDQTATVHGMVLEGVMEIRRGMEEIKRTERARLPDQRRSLLRARLEMDYGPSSSG